MALGGGTFIAQNKVLPGTYINFVSVAQASATLSDRGIVTMPLALDWGVENSVFEVTAGDFQKNSMKIFGYPYTDDALKGLRDLFLYASTLYAYRLNGGGVKASNTYATAKYSGTRGNSLKIVIQANADDPTKYDVLTYMGTTLLDSQTVASAAALVDNDYVTFVKTATLTITASIPLTGGTNGSISGASYQAYLDKIESYRYNTMGVVTTDNTIKSLFASFCKRIRDEVGAKFQLVLHNYTNPDYMGVISVKNRCVDGAYTGTIYTSAGVYTVTIGGTLASGDKITVCGVEVTLTATTAASATAAAQAVLAALGTMDEYSIAENAGVITFTEKTGHYGAGQPSVSIDSTNGTATAATTTAAGSTSGTIYPNEAAGVYWTTGAQGGCAVNKSLQNRKYDGEFTFDLDYTQNQLIAAIKAGEFTFHSVDGVARVLEDINTMVTTTDTCGDVFKDNQTIRVIDQIGNDIAVLFSTKYLGVVPNDIPGRTALWSDIKTHHEQLQEIRAIQNFDENDVVVEQGMTKKAVVVSDAVEVVNAMGKLYMTVSVS